MGTALRDVSGHRGGRPETAVGTVRPPHGERPPLPRRAAAPRAAGLSDTARLLLCAGAVLGRPFTLHEAAGLLRVPPLHLLAAVEEVLGHGLLTEDGDALALAGGVTGETVYAALPRPVRRAMHREAARVLQEEGGAPAEVARQLVQGWRYGARVPAGLRELLQEGHARLSPVLAEVVRQLIATDRVTEARALVDAVLAAGTDPLTSAVLVMMLGETTRHPHHAEGVTARAREALDGPAAGTARARLLAARAVGLCYEGDDLAAELAATEALSGPGAALDAPAADLAADPAGEPTADGLAGPADGLARPAVSRPGEPCPAESRPVDPAAAVPGGRAPGPAGSGRPGPERAGDPLAEVRVIVGIVRSVTARHRGDLRAAVLHARRAVAVGRPLRGTVPPPELWLAQALAARDEFDEAHALLDIGEHDAERHATAWPGPVWQHARAVLYRAAGRLADAEREAQHALWQVGTDGSLYIRLNALLGDIAVQRGELVAGGRHLRRARQMIALGHCVVDDEDLRWRLGMLRAAEGDPAGALQTLLPFYEGLARRRELLVREPRAAAELVRVALAAEEPSRARQVAAAARDLARRNAGCASLAGAAQHAQGILARSRAALRAAVRDYAGSPRTLDRAAALEDAGTAEHTAGGSRSAARLLAEAERHYRAAGAEPGARRARAVGGEARARARARGAAEGSAVTGWQSLTEAELRVVKVVAEGLTNKQAADRLFLSPHTVDSHLRHSFAKLGINNRVELACAVMRERDEPHPENA